MNATVESFSTRSVPAAGKTEAWNAILRGRISQVRARPRDPMRFDGQLIRRRIGPLAALRVECAGVQVWHTRADAARLANPPFHVLMPVQGAFSITHGDHAPTDVPTGTFCLIDLAKPFELEHGDGVHTLCLNLPRSTLESCVPHASRYAGLPLNAASIEGSVLSAVMNTLSGGHFVDRGESHTPLMARSIAGIVGAALMTHRVPGNTRDVAARLAAFREYIDVRLVDAEFGPAELAQHFGVSERYVRLVFQSAGESLSGYLLRRRLERAARLLSGPEGANHTIMQIAFDCGFNNASHFGQRFLAQFGATPRDFRAAHQHAMVTTR